MNDPGRGHLHSGHQAGAQAASQYLNQANLAIVVQ
jgi:hypothetical protein